MHESVKMDTPIEFLNITPVNPLISKCQIKVCYVGEDPNRNRSIITKEAAIKMANSLPGCPIVGYYNEETEDFEQHNRYLEIEDNKVVFKDGTRPYGFVDLNAKVWFQKYLDDNENEHEYLMTEGYLWTGQYEEAQRIIEKGNNQSMELDEKTLDAFWTKDNNGKTKFFIINDAIISKLCILGQDYEPCFEGAGIQEQYIQFSLTDDFKQELSLFIDLMSKALKEGGTPVFTTYAVEIGDSLWEALWSFLSKRFPHIDDCGHVCGSMYRVQGIFEEGEQKFAILQCRETKKFFRMDFALTEAEGFVCEGNLIEVEQTYIPVGEPQFNLEDVEAYELEFVKKQKEEPEEDEKEEEPEESEEEDEEEEKKKYNLEEIVEYIELCEKYEQLEASYNKLLDTNASLVSFKNQIEREQKHAMIDSFYMLSDEDKKDVIDNIDTYSLDDIEAKLSIICVRNKVSFNLEEDNKNSAPVVYNLNPIGDDDATPAWVKSIQRVEKK